MKRRILILALVAAPFAAFAQHNHSHEGPNGGVVEDAAGHHLEFTAKGTELMLYLFDEDMKPVATSGLGLGRAVIQDTGKTATVTLQSATPNKIVGLLPAPLNKGAKVVISAKLGGKSLQARFVKD